MDRYEILQEIGNGAYGLVHKALHRETRQVVSHNPRNLDLFASQTYSVFEQVAIKAMKKTFASFNEVIQLREIQSLRKLSHDNIVNFKEVIRENDGKLFLVFEYMDENLYQLMKRTKRFLEEDVRSIVKQTTEGLKFMHERGFFHRDIKPENLLMRGRLVKIADFGLAREIRSSPPYTDYV